MRARRANKTTSLAAAGLLASLSFLLSDAIAAPPEFRDFTPGACPTCELPPRYGDVIKLKAGSAVKGRIVADNDAFYVVERFGQIRVVGKQLIESVTYAAGSKPNGLSNGDHILLKNGHVLVGTIVEEKDSPGLFRLDSRLGNKSQFIAFKSEISAVYKNGKPYDFEPGHRYDYKVGTEYRTFAK
jgi:hypothetical protein